MKIEEINFANKLIYLLNVTNKCQKSFVNDILKKKISEQALSDYLRDNKKPNYETFQLLIEMCRKNSSELKNLSADFFFSKSNNISNQNLNIANIMKLEDKTITKIKDIHSKEPYILNDFINNISKDFWKNISDLKNVKQYEKINNEIEITLHKLEDNKFNEYLISVKDLYLKYSDNTNLKKDINNYYKEMNKLENEAKKDWEDNYYQLEILFGYDKNGEFRKLHYMLESILDNSVIITSKYCSNKMITEMKKNYNLDNFKELESLYKQLNEKLFFELFIYKNTEIEEYELWEINDFKDSIKSLRELIDKKICCSKEFWQNLKKFFIPKDIIYPKKQLKYEINEFMTLYMNK